MNVTTYHNDNARTGLNSQETTLTPANVNSSQFGKLFTVTLDGWVYAQPFYLSKVSITAEPIISSMSPPSTTVCTQLTRIAEPSTGSKVSSISPRE